MTAQIRPTRMDVNDRFCWLGFAIRTGEPNVEAEVVLASDIGLFQPENRQHRTAANFYTSRESGRLAVPRGDGVFIVPPEVLARFIGQDRIYFGLATGRSGAGGLTVDALPREGSPYVSFKGFTGRTLRRTFSSERVSGPPLLEWAGDAAKPGSEPASSGSTTSGDQRNVAANGSTQPSPSTPYDDGFGPMPDIPARQSSYARAHSNDDGPQQRPAPPPRARAMDGGVGVAVAIGGFLLESVRDSSGDISWDLDQFRAIKHPNDTAPANPAPFRDAPTIRLDDWPVWEGVDDISAWFKIDWQFNGRSLGNVRIVNIGTNDAVGFGLHVRGQIMDDNQLYPPSNCAALRITMHYRFSRSLGSDGIAIRNITLYGDGTHASNGDWVQASTFGRAMQNGGDMIVPPTLPGNERQRAERIGGQFAPRVVEALDRGLNPKALQPMLDILDPQATPQPLSYARARGNGNGAVMPPPPRIRSSAMNPAAAAAIAGATFVLTSIRDNRGDISWDLQQMNGIKHPNDVAPTTPRSFSDGQVIKLDDWPTAGGVLDDINAWFQIEWQYDGQSVGNVAISNIGTNDSVGWGLNVSARITHDNRLHAPSNCARLKVRFDYRFDRTVGSEVLAYREVLLYGDGRWETSGDWLQSSVLSAGNQSRQPAYVQ